MQPRSGQTPATGTAPPTVMEQLAQERPVADDNSAAARLESMRGSHRTRDAAQHRLGVRLGLKYNGSYFYQSDDRTILECLILPFYQLSAAHQRLLFAGTDWYTHGYNRLFRAKEYMTLDADPDKAQYGAARHVTAPLDTLAAHVSSSSLDLIVCNGLVGWGLNDRAAAEASFQACFDALRPGGHLLIGWNDLPEYRPFLLAELNSMARFAPLHFPPLGASVHLVDNEWRHVFSFFVKPE